MDNKINKKKKAFLKLLNWPIYGMIFFVIVDIFVFIIDIKAGFVLLAALAAYAIALVVYILIKKRHFTNTMVDFASSYAQMQKRMLDNFIVPYGMLDENGKIMWLNNAFSEIIGKENYHKSIAALFPEMEGITLDGTEENNNVIVKVNDKTYRLAIKEIDMSSMSGAITDISMAIMDDADKIYTIYLFDETEITACRKELNEERFVSGLIYIDNYEEALESIDEVRRSLLIALVDRKINKYVAVGGGIVKKLEKDKYLVAMRHKFLEQLCSDRFSVLEDVKSVNIGNEMSVTLSIGIGARGKSYEENYEMARTAIDLALGRGGDQAVVREGEKTTYYGGKSNTVEKNTRVKARVKAHALRELLESADNVLIMGHKMSDADAVGAAIGVYTAARTLDKKANIILNDITTSLQPIVDLFKNGDYEKDLFIKNEEALTKVTANTLLVIVDVNRSTYTECPELITKCRMKVVLDHHRRGSDSVEGATLSYIEPYASSASEMIAEILQYISDNIKIKPIEADAIYSGIIIDTNNFANKAGARTFEAAAFLRRKGADIIRVRKLLRSDMNEYKARAEAVRHAEVYRDSYALSICPSAGLQSPTIVGAQAANELLNITGIKASIVFTHYNDQVYISARSIDEVNVQLIMERLGGGGHMTIAGAQLEDITMDEAIKLVKETLDVMIQEGAI